MATLTPSQMRVYRHGRGHAVVLAGAGAGKTAVMVQRVIRLIREEGVDSSRIAMLTFTKKAAETMKSRIAQELPDNRVSAQTFHAFCYRWLKARDITFQGKDVLLPDNLAWLANGWITTALEESGLNIESDLAKKLIDRFRNFGIYAPEAEDVADRTEVTGDMRQMYVAYSIYFREMRAKGYYEMGDLPVMMLRNLRDSDEFRREVMGCYDHIIVDEYQDTDAAQEQILEILCGRPGLSDEPSGISLMVVGDPGQAIYGFRNANPKFIVEFRDRWKATEYQMLENFRSTPTIIAAANRLLSASKDVGTQLLATQPDGSAIKVLDFSAEAYDIARQLQAMKDVKRITNWRDAAVLYRANSQAGMLESALTDAEIPYVVRDSAEGFFGLLDVKALVSYVRVALFEDVESLKFLWNRPNRMLKKDILEQATRGATTIQQILNNALGIARYTAQRSVEGIIGVVRGLREMVVAKATTIQLLEAVIEATRYVDYVKKRMEEDPRPGYEPLEYIKKLLEIAGRRPKPDKFLLHVRRVIENSKAKKQEKDGVALLTIHSAKGMEFDAVFIAGCTSENMPHKKSILPADQREERRLMYVAVTRAKKYLCISTDRRWPSPFIAEMGLEITDWKDKGLQLPDDVVAQPKERISQSIVELVDSAEDDLVSRRRRLLSFD